MNASGNNFPRSRRLSYIAGLFGTVSVVALGALFFQMDQLERSYGGIRTDIQRFTQERDEARARRDAVLQEVVLRRTEEHNLEEAVSSLATRRDALAAELVSKGKLQAVAETALADLSAKAKVAQEAINSAATMRNAVEALAKQKAELDRAIVKASQAKTDLNVSITQATRQLGQKRDELDALVKKQEELGQEIGKRQDEIAGLDDRKREIANLDKRKGSLDEELKALSTNLEERQQALEKLAADIKLMEADAAEARKAQADAKAERADAETSGKALEKSLRSLEQRQATAQGDLASATKKANRALQDAADADARTKTARAALLQIQSEAAVSQSQIRQLQKDKAAAAAEVSAASLELTRLQTLGEQAKSIASEVPKLQGQKKALEEAVAGLLKQQAKAATDLAAMQEGMEAQRAASARALSAAQSELTKAQVLRERADATASDIPMLDGQKKVLQEAIGLLAQQQGKAAADVRATEDMLQKARTAAAEEVAAARTELASLQVAKERAIAIAAEVPQLQGQRKSLEYAVSSLSEKQEKTAADLSAMLEQLEHARHELADLNGRRGALLQEIVTLKDTATALKTTPSTKELNNADAK